MKAILYGAGTDFRKWNACHKSYVEFMEEGRLDCAYKYHMDGEPDLLVNVHRGKHSITITVQPVQEERHE